MAEPASEDALAWLTRADRYVAAAIAAEQAARARRQRRAVEPGGRELAGADEPGAEDQAASPPSAADQP